MQLYSSIFINNEMIRKLLLSGCVLSAFALNAITYNYGQFNNSRKTCALVGWGGQQPTSGKLVLKETFEKDGVTYKVTSIAPHALDNLTEVTEITIPANVIKIGEVYDGYVEETKNFFNCPKLAIFKVATGNETFAATGAGLLMYKGGTSIVRVPPAITFSSGTTLKMSKSVEAIGRDAFAGNSTITNIALSPNIVLFSEGCGFSDMTALKEFSINGTETPSDFSILDGVLYDAKKEILYSFPPCKTAYNFTVPSTVWNISTKAFRNTANLYEISFNKVHTISKEAFANSGITKLIIPSSVRKIENGAFRGLTRLQEMTIESKLQLPDNFARDCKLLTKVTLPNGLKYIGHNAFKNCTRLEQFPFLPDISYEGDSIFSGCGFKSVVFREGMMPKEGLDIGEATFAGNPELQIVDMSKLAVVEDGYGSDVPLSYVADCPKLHSILFPKMASFWASNDRPVYNLGVNPSLEYIFLGAFSLSGRPALLYDHGSHFPVVYMQTTDAPQESWPLRDFFSVSGGAVCKPQIYCEGYTMAHDWSATEYIYPGASYFVPGGTAANYKEARDYGCPVIEMYNFRVSDRGGKLCVQLTDKLDGLMIRGVYANGDIALGTPASDGTLLTDMAYQLVDNITVEYNVRGANMKTFYPDMSAMSGIGEVDAYGSPMAITLDGKMVCFGNVADYTVTDMAGRTVMSGKAESAGLSSLAAGVYVVSARGEDGTSAVRKISVD